MQGELPISRGAELLLEEALRAAESDTPEDLRSVTERIRNAIEDANTNPTVINGQIAFEVP